MIHRVRVLYASFLCCFRSFYFSPFFDTCDISLYRNSLVELAEMGRAKAKRGGLSAHDLRLLSLLSHSSRPVDSILVISGYFGVSKVFTRRDPTPYPVLGICRFEFPALHSFRARGVNYRDRTYSLRDLLPFISPFAFVFSSPPRVPFSFPSYVFPRVICTRFVAWRPSPFSCYVEFHLSDSASF